MARKFFDSNVKTNIDLDVLFSFQNSLYTIQGITLSYYQSVYITQIFSVGGPENIRNYKCFTWIRKLKKSYERKYGF